MQFASPLFFIGFAALLIPILIHLFNFRRYRTYYFSNLKMLRDVAQKSKRESQLKHWVVLLLRMMAIVCLVLAFAQPYIPTQQSTVRNENLVTIYVDNSFSMEASTATGTLFSESVENAKQIVQSYGFADRFLLYNNDFTAVQSRPLNRDEAMEQLDTWTISPQSRTDRELLAFEANAIAPYADEYNQIHYYISDFQKNNFDVAHFMPQKESASFWVYKSASECANISIDSCWFLAPVMRQGEQVTLKVRLSNYGDEDMMKLPINLYLNGKVAALATVDIAAHSNAETQMVYTLTAAGQQEAILKIEDAPIIFDDNLYFTYTVAAQSPISVIYDDAPNRYLDALYGMDSVFDYHSMSMRSIDYNILKNSNLVVLSELKTISSGLADELHRYLQNGGTVLLLPHAEQDLRAWNAFLSQATAQQYAALVQQPREVAKFNDESVYFKGSLQHQNERMDMPKVKQYFTFAQRSGEAIMTLEDQNPLLVSHRVGSGEMILSAVAMSDSYGEIYKHALFFVPLHNMGIRSAMQAQNYYTIGKDKHCVLPVSNDNKGGVYAVKWHNLTASNDATLIPEQRSMGGHDVIFLGQDMYAAGFYEVLQDDHIVTTIALNDSRKESDLSYYTEGELRDFIKRGSDTLSVQLVDATQADITHQIQAAVQGSPLWRIFIYIALALFAAEILVLRLWGPRRREKVG